MMLAFFKSRSPRHRATRAGMTHTLTPREAVARHLFGEACQWSALDMLDYDNSQEIRADWLTEADRRIAATHEDVTVATAWGMNLDQWQSLTNFERAECRRNVTAAPRSAS